MDAYMDASELSVEIEVTKAISVLNIRRNIGDKVLVDPNTARNLIKKGWVKTADAEQSLGAEPVITVNR